MAKRIFLLTMFGFFIHPFLMGCDSCGSVGGNGIGLMSAYKNNFIGIGWQYASFRGVPEHGDGSIDHLHTLELSLRYHVKDRFKVLFYQPFRINNRNVNGQTDGLNGFSDTRIIGSYSLLKDVTIGTKINVFLEIGAGVKLPVGKYNAKIQEVNLPENFNPGNGSWGYLFQPSLVLTLKKAGLVVNGYYQHHSKSTSDYQFGHQLSTQVLFFWEKRLSNNFNLVPNAGINSEWISTDHYANGKRVEGTGGKGTYFSAGINFKTNQWIIGATYDHPLVHHYSNGEVDAKHRLAAQVAYIF